LIRIEETMREHVIGIGHNNPPLEIRPVPWLAGARALIRRRKRPVETAGRARENDWILRFERRTAPEIDELMGWTGGDDTLATGVELTFASREQAIGYAERQGLAYVAEPEPMTYGASVLPLSRVAGRCSRVAPATCGSALAAARALPQLERAFVNPAAVFASPADLLSRRGLTRECRRELLRRWEWDERLKEEAATEGMAEGEPSRLDEVKAALLALDEVGSPSPSAPAAVAPAVLGEFEMLAA
jgi:hypothetical protein